VVRQYTRFRYTDRLTQLGVLASFGSVGDSFDNARAESTIGLYKSEVIHHQGPWRGANDVELVSMASRNCPVVDMKTAHWWPWDLPSGGHQRRWFRCGALRSPWLGARSDKVDLGDRLIAVGAGPARSDAAGEELAVRAATLVQVAGLALGAFVDDAWAGIGAGAHRVAPSGVTPSPASAWDRRTLSPLV